MVYRSVLALSLILLVASFAHAATIFITPALAPPPDGSLKCHIVNGHPTQTIELVRQIFDLNGNVVFNFQADAIMLGPLESIEVTTPNDSARYCIVRLLSGSKTKVRVSISVTDSSGTTTAALEGRP